MTYWQRANRAYYYVYGFTPPEPWEKDDGKEGCEYAVISILAKLHDVKNTNPLTRRYKTFAELLAWFNEKHPLKEIQKCL